MSMLSVHRARVLKKIEEIEARFYAVPNLSDQMQENIIWLINTLRREVSDNGSTDTESRGD